MAEASDWRMLLCRVREALRSAPVSTLEAAQVELRKMLAELVARCGKPLDEAEMDAARLLQSRCW